MSQKPSFSDRVRDMAALADNLLAMANLASKYADQVRDEADRMAAAQRRFQDERAAKRRKADR